MSMSSIKHERSVPVLVRWAAVAAVALAVVTAPAVGPVRAEEPLRVFATIPDLADIAERVGGDEVETFSMISGREDAHFGEPKPSFVKRLSQADLFITVGMELEIGYEPVLRRNARNPRIAPGQPGYVVAAQVIEPLGVPKGTTVTRAMGDVHAQGSPHFNVDPISGLRVADLIRSRLAELRPGKAAYFAANYEALRRLVGAKLVGEALSAKYDAVKLAVLFQRGRLADFLEGQGDADALGGWLGTMMPYRGRRVVDDHAMWPYFARTFGIVVAAHMEPKPGLAPTTRHLKEVIDLMNAEDIRVIVKSAYYDPRHAEFVARATGAHVATLAHQVGAVDAADDWVDMIDYNVRTIAAAMGGQG